MLTKKRSFFIILSLFFSFFIFTKNALAETSFSCDGSLSYTRTEYKCTLNRTTDVLQCDSSTVGDNTNAVNQASGNCNNNGDCQARKLKNDTCSGVGANCKVVKASTFSQPYGPYNWYSSLYCRNCGYSYGASSSSNACKNPDIPRCFNPGGYYSLKTCRQCDDVGSTAQCSRLYDDNNVRKCSSTGTCQIVACSPNWTNWSNTSGSNGGCGGDPTPSNGTVNCKSDQMMRKRSNGCGQTEYKCFDDKYTQNNWVERSCGRGTCGAHQMQFTRDSIYSCLDNEQCRNDTPTDWVDKACGPSGGCTKTQRHQTRPASTYGCYNTSQCVPDATCSATPRPDLTVSAFHFLPGDSGAPGGTVDVSVQINNTGNAGTGGSFDVRLRNGNGAGITINNTPALGAGNSRTVTFNNIAKPNAPGSYTAIATVDSKLPQDDINESDEGNNDRDSNYDITGSISGTVWVDNGNGAIGAGDTGYSGATLTVNTTPVETDTTNTTGDYSIAGIPVGNHATTLSLPAVPAGWTIVTAPPPLSNPRTSNITNANRTGIDFLVIPPAPTYSISGTVYQDINNNDAFDAGIDTPYPGGATLTSTSTKKDTTDATGAYSILLNPVGNWTTALSGLPARWTVVVRNGFSNPRDSFITNANIIGINFLVKPPTYSISGGVFIDSLAPTAEKTSTEPYYNGNETIRIFGINGTPNPPTTSYVSGVASGYVIDGLYSGDYQIQYTPSPPTGYKTTWPSNNISLGFPAYDVVVDNPGCNINQSGGTLTQSSLKDASCDATGNIAGLNFGIDLIGGEQWFQTVGGDLRKDNDLTNVVPDTGVCAGDVATQAYAAAAKTSATTIDPGIVFTAQSSANLGAPAGAQNAKASTKGWLALNNKFNPARGSVRTSYTYLHDVIAKGGLPTPSVYSGACSGTAPNCTFNANFPASVYTADGLTIPAAVDYNFTGGRNYIFLVNGNLRIERNLIVPIGSTVFFSVKGDITVASGVTRIDGIYSADDNFTVDTGGGALNVNGSVIANANHLTPGGTLINNRDLGGGASGNAFCPSIKFSFRPDFVLNLPATVKVPNYIIQEVAPGPQFTP